MEMVPIWMWIMLVMGFILVLHIGKIRLRNRAWEYTHDDDICSRALHKRDKD